MGRLRHRGPDWSGLHCHQDCYLAHQRLAIVDPTSGDQPLYNEDKTVVVTVFFFLRFYFFSFVVLFFVGYLGSYRVYSRKIGISHIFYFDILVCGNPVACEF